MGATARTRHRSRPASSGRGFVHPLVQLSSSPREDSIDLGVEHVARQPVLRDAEAHHAAAKGPASWIATWCPMRARWYAADTPTAGAHDEDALAAGRGDALELPAVFARLVAGNLSTAWMLTRNRAARDAQVSQGGSKRAPSAPASVCLHHSARRGGSRRSRRDRASLDSSPAGTRFAGGSDRRRTGRSCASCRCGCGLGPGRA